MLGQDQNFNEYWFFKNDDTKLYSKRSGEWFFLDREEDFDQLIDSLNIKGIREKKLSEALKKIRTSIKLKKPKAYKASPNKAEVKGDQEDVEMKNDDEIDLKPTDEAIEEENENREKHHMFDNDNYERVIIDAVWFNKSIPKKYGKAKTATRGNKANQQDDTVVRQISIDSLKQQIMEMESLWTSTMSAGQFFREWARPKIQEELRTALLESDSIVDLFRILSKLDEGFSNPDQVTRKELNEQELQDKLAAMKDVEMKNEESKGD